MKLYTVKYRCPAGFTWTTAAAGQTVFKVLREFRRLYPHVRVLGCREARA
jgi:hypothetical protein